MDNNFLLTKFNYHHYQEYSNLLTNILFIKYCYYPHQFNILLIKPHNNSNNLKVPVLTICQHQE